MKKTGFVSFLGLLVAASFLSLSSCTSDTPPPDFGTPIQREFVMGGSGSSSTVLCYSEDGSTWTPYTDITSDSSPYYVESAAADSSGFWVAACMHVSGQKRAFLLSNNGDHWFASSNSGVPDGDYYYYSSIATDGNGLWVCVGGNWNEPKNIVVYSTDDAWTWSKAVSSQSLLNGWLRVVAWGGGRFIAGGFAGLMAKSSDGDTWQVLTPPAAGDISWIAYDSSAGRWMATIGGVVYTSINGGDSWTTALNDGGGYTFVACNPVTHRWAALGYDRVAYSDGGVTWHLAATPPNSGESAYGFTCGRAGKWVMVTNSTGRIFTSTDADIWTEAADSAAYPSLYAVASIP